MCQSTPTPVQGQFDPSAFPSAWYELSARLDATLAVAYWFNETLPMQHGMSANQIEMLNRAASLSAAVYDLLELCQQDASRIETQLKGA